MEAKHQGMSRSGQDRRERQVRLQLSVTSVTVAVRAKAAEDSRTPKRKRMAKLLECGCPLPLFSGMPMLTDSFNRTPEKQVLLDNLLDFLSSGNAWPQSFGASSQFDGF